MCSRAVLQRHVVTLDVLLFPLEEGDPEYLGQLYELPDVLFLATLIVDDNTTYGSCEFVSRSPEMLQ